jgi:hypothetical protein
MRAAADSTSQPRALARAEVHTARREGAGLTARQATCCGGAEPSGPAGYGADVTDKGGA